MSKLLRALLVVSSLPVYLPICTQAHMQMSWPYPLRSPLDPAVNSDNKNYDNTFPLSPDGSNFPCKHFQYIDTNPQANDIKATYQAGGTYNLTLTGTATHMGGSCQISISYDNGATFKVIESIIGGCPLTKTLDFTIPSYAPSSDSALLSWSWFNIVGNREMYQNCARVQIQGTPVQRYRRTTYRRQASIDSLPDMFACNVGNGCTTIERREVVFPNPGEVVVYGQDAITPDQGPGFTLTSVPTGNAFQTISPAAPSSQPTLTAAPFPMGNGTMPGGPTGTGTGYSTGYWTGTGTGPSTSLTSSSNSMMPSFTTITIVVTVTPSSTSTTSAATSTTSTTSGMVIARGTSTTTTPIVTTIVTVVPISSTMTTLTTTTTTSTSSATISTGTVLTGPCTPGSFACNSPTSFSQCVSNGSGSTSYTYMGSVAAGMQCVAGQIVRENAGPCTPSGSIFCNGPNAFYMCDQGGLIDMGPVAAGTTCVNGVIGFAS